MAAHHGSYQNNFVCWIEPASTGGNRVGANDEERGNLRLVNRPNRPFFVTRRNLVIPSASAPSAARGLHFLGPGLGTGSARNLLLRDSRIHVEIPWADRKCDPENDDDTGREIP